MDRDVGCPFTFQDCSAAQGQSSTDEEGLELMYVWTGRRSRNG